jgi:hypothetical protein
MDNEGILPETRRRMVEAQRGQRDPSHSELLQINGQHEGGGGGRVSIEG